MRFDPTTILRFPVNTLVVPKSRSRCQICGRSQNRTYSYEYSLMATVLITRNEIKIIRIIGDCVINVRIPVLRQCSHSLSDFGFYSPPDGRSPDAFNSIHTSLLLICFALLCLRESGRRPHSNQ